MATTGEPLCRVDGEVGEDPGGTRPFERQQRFQDDAILHPAAIDGTAQHGVLAAHLVGEGGHAERLVHAPDDVEIGHAGLHHDHVGALGQVERHFAQGLVAVGRVHLVGLLVALAERAARADGPRNGP